MEEQVQGRLPAQQESIEIELSADDVLNLSRSHPAAATPKSTPKSTSQARRRFWRSPLGLAGAGSLLCLAIGAGYGIGLSKPPARTSPPVVHEVQVSVAPLSEPVDLTPVRVRNPFDKSETFEFPAGTSEQEARDAVADLLLQRAMERQARYDARKSKSRRST